MSSHDEFLELCAVSTSGQLTAQEQKRLEEHLAGCASCREVLKQYESLVREAIPDIAASQASVSPADDLSWSQEEAEARLLRRLHRNTFPTAQEGGRGNHAAKANRAPSPAHEATWRSLWMLYVAAIVLFGALAVCTYRMGVQRGVNTAGISGEPQRHADGPSEQQLSAASRERDGLRSEMNQRNQLIADLRSQLQRQSAEVRRLMAHQVELDTQVQTKNTNTIEVAQERDHVQQQLENARSDSLTMQAKLNSLEQQVADDRIKAAAVEVQISDLTRSLHERDQTIDRQRELLAHDRDIRELMGARDLYIAEVFDVERDGETKKPYGRVFYTKGKSLIFYAYDLDEQKRVSDASFQAWGGHPGDWQHAVSLGIFYVDNAAKKRWVLKFDNPRSLAQVDAVFVTVEPSGGSRKPSGKPLLFAYLKMEPNHP